MLAASRGATPRTKTFTGNEVFAVPSTTTTLKTAVGKGADGAPAVPWDGTHSHVDIITYYSNGAYYDTESVGLGDFAGRAPADYCDPVEPYTAIDAPPNATRQVCHYYTDNESAATTGAATTGFNKTFPGGAGGAASLTSFTNVAVIPGSSYSVVVPSGGTLTITYDE